MPYMSDEQVEAIFSFHPATPDTGPKHDLVREDVRSVAVGWNNALPDSPEKTLAIRHLQQAMMFANAAIAIHTPRESNGA